MNFFPKGLTWLKRLERLFSNTFYLFRLPTVFSIKSYNQSKWGACKFLVLYIHSNTFFLSHKNSSNNSLWLLITFERKHVGQKGKMPLKEEISMYPSCNFALGRSFRKTVHFFVSLGISFVSMYWGLFINIQVFLFKTVPSIFEWCFYSKWVRSCLAF